MTSKIYGLPIESTKIEDIVAKSNIINLADDELLYGFAECIENIDFALEHDDVDEARLWAAPTVFEIYRRAYGNDLIDIRTLPSVVRHPPWSLHFWANEHIIRRVWTLLVTDGLQYRRNETHVST